MPTYRIICDVKSVSGTQQFLVNATDETEARRKFKDGSAEFESEEIEVLSLGDPEISLATDV